MAIEEITLSVPLSVPEAGRLPVMESHAINPNDQLVRQYRRVLADRRRFAWTRRGRQKRYEAFEVAYRSLVKQLARDVTEPIGDRTIRLDARTRLYASLTGMLSAAAADQLQVQARGRRMLTCGLVLTGAGLTSLAAALLSAL